MTDVRPHPIFRMMPSLTDVAFLIPFVFLFTRMQGVQSMLGDGDTGWHIRTGEWILAHHRVPHQDLFSYTMPDKDWFAWEWLWDVGAAWLHQRWGLGGVVLASMFVICLTCALLYRVVNRRCGNPLVAIGFTVLAASASTIHWLARPHLFTLLFTVVFLSIVDRAREGRTSLLWWLPAITVLWTNLHGGFFVGIIILGSYAAGELINALLATDSAQRKTALRASMPYLAAAAGCLIASLINPYFYQLHVHIFKYLRDPYMLQNIVEFQGTNFQNGGAGFFEAMLMLGLAAAVWHCIHKRFTEVILILGWGHLALLSARNIPLFAVIAAPIGAAAMVECLEAFRCAPVAQWLRDAVGMVEVAGAEIQPIEGLWRTHLLSALVLVLIGLGIASPGAGKMLKPEYDTDTYPARAMALLDSTERIFTTDQWGDYLIYNLSPKGTKVYFDGRSDFYGGTFCREYMDVVNVKYNWEQTLARHGVDTILLSPDAALATAIKESSHWRVVYDDGKAIVFRLAESAAGRGDRTTTSGTGGWGRGLTVTGPNQNVHLIEHESEPIGVSPL